MFEGRHDIARVEIGHPKARQDDMFAEWIGAEWETGKGKEL
jgi:hypothetical protein